MLERPRLRSNFTIWCEPPDERGEEVLRAVSENRSLKLKGYAFREFERAVLPLLDGKRSLDEIHACTADLFDREDLAAAVRLLTEQGVLVEGEEPSSASSGPSPRTATQVNLFNDYDDGRLLQHRLSEATVAIVGLGGAGAAVAKGLAAAGVGKVLAIDGTEVKPTDIYLTGDFGSEDVGRRRADALADRIAGTASEASVVADTRPHALEEELGEAIDGADWVICCLDRSQLNLILKLNRVCFRERKPWISADVAGSEVTVGPTVRPGETACYMCYRMRSVACAGNPEDAFEYERRLDRIRADQSERRASLNFAVGFVANVLGLETVKALAGFGESALDGRLLTMDLASLAIEKHEVLRKPWCPVCHAAADA
jgi:adenylyltransferase/sulfurtransferase